MKFKLVLIAVSLAIAGSGLINRLMPSRVVQAPRQQKAGVAEHIQRVENGLLPSIIIKGQSSPMKLADRMVHYKVPGVSIAVISNGGSRLAQEIIRAIAKEYDWPDPPSPREKTLAKVDQKLYEAYAGQYDADVRLTVSVENGHLYVLAPPLGPERVELYPESETRFFMLADNISISFEKDEQVQVNKILVHFGGGTREGKRVK